MEKNNKEPPLPITLLSSKVALNIYQNRKFFNSFLWNALLIKISVLQRRTLMCRSGLYILLVKRLLSKIRIKCTTQYALRIMSRRHSTLSSHHKSPCVFTLETKHKKEINCVKISNHEASLIATASEDKTALLFRLNADCSAATQVQELQGHRSSVTSVAYHPNGLLIATSSEDHTIKFWRIDDGSCVFTLLAHKLGGITSVVFDKSGTYFASTSWDNTAKIWQLNEDYTLPRRVSWLKGHKHIVDSFAFDPHNEHRIAATASHDKTAKVWIIIDKNSKCVSTLSGHTRSVSSVLFHPTRRDLIVTSSKDGTVIFTQIDPDFGNMTCSTTSVLKLMTPGNTIDINAITIDKSGLRLLTCSWDNIARLYLIVVNDQGNIGCVLLSTLRHEFGVFSGDFSLDEIAVTGGLDTSLKFSRL
jgi:WD40 repeat protein